MKHELRAGAASDAGALSALVSEYMRELFGRAWSGSAEAVARDGCGAQFETMVVVRGGELVGFGAWERTYDLHHCIWGAQVMDLYVRPELRGRGVALELVAAIAAAARAGGGVFVKGLAVGDARTRRLYERVAMAFEGADCIVGGRAFRVLADLAGRPARAIVAGLPEKSANYEP
jgi:GNAT superfamily N-acetyltransferase